MEFKNLQQKLKVITFFSFCSGLVSIFYLGYYISQENRSILHKVSKTDKMRCFCLFNLTKENLLKQKSIKCKALEVKQGLEKEIASTMKQHGSTFNNETKVCKRFITLHRHLGRMGNQMFEVAALIGSAYKHDMLPVIPNAFPLSKYFDLPNVLPRKKSKLINVTTCVCKKSAVYYTCTREFSTGKNVSLYGNLQSWKYFKGLDGVIKTVFQLKSHHMLNAKSFFNNVSFAGYQHVSIHIRRGDITSKKFMDDGYAVADLNFINKAKQFYLNKYSKVQFFVVTNDPPWCRKYVKDVIISPFKDPGDDMALLTLSDHVIVTTGTFGWWGAWLSGGTTVYFNKYPRQGSELEKRISRADYYPPGWIGMS